MRTRRAKREFAVRKASGNGGGPHAEKPGQDARPAFIAQANDAWLGHLTKIHGLHRKVQAMIILVEHSALGIQSGNSIEPVRS